MNDYQRSAMVQHASAIGWPCLLLMGLVSIALGERGVRKHEFLFGRSQAGCIRVGEAEFARPSP